MFAKLSALVGGGPALNYNVEPEPYEVAWGCWTHFPGSSREDGSPVSVFRIAATDPNDLKLVAARNGVKRLRMVSKIMFGPSAGALTSHQAVSAAAAVDRLVPGSMGADSRCWVHDPLSYVWVVCHSAAAPPQHPGVQGQHRGAGEGSAGGVPSDRGSTAADHCAEGPRPGRQAQASKQCV